MDTLKVDTRKMKMDTLKKIMTSLLQKGNYILFRRKDNAQWKCGFCHQILSQEEVLPLPDNVSLALEKPTSAVPGSRLPR